MQRWTPALLPPTPPPMHQRCVYDSALWRANGAPAWKVEHDYGLACQSLHAIAEAMRETKACIQGSLVLRRSRATPSLAVRQGEIMNSREAVIGKQAREVAPVLAPE